MNVLPDIAVTVKLKISVWEDYPRLDGMPNVIRGLYKKETP